MAIALLLLCSYLVGSIPFGVIVGLARGARHHHHACHGGPPWAGPGVPVKAIKWMLMHHSPLVIWPMLDAKMWRWGAACP